MNDERDERGLRDLFARQRADELGRAPAFAQTVASARRRGRRATVRRTMWLLGTASAAAIVVAMVMMPGGVGEGTQQVAVELSSVRWRSPTDFLLETPGAELMRTTPRIVRLDDMNPPALGRGHERGEQP